ncbi:FecR family protein [Pontibacter actiniarum]|uniref:Iron dicitrate transport regulator FecR n=1 Tax=Pontibacter actiniarum TaxID=323450 RepID=A0A1X9YT49_9BACT|nr:FecR domain-containing protein [Pontibacter actiniarum]ARS36011.1 hypothetical protein CA264_11510 [Pontibacter actiniarum]
MRLNNSNFQLADLICKSIAGTLTEEESAVLTQWKAQPENEKLYDRIVDVQTIRHRFETYDQFDSHRALRTVKTRIREKSKPQAPGFLVQYLKYAAVLFVVGLAGSLYVYLNNKPGKELLGAAEQPVQTQGVQTEPRLMPAKNKAVLLLAGGEEIDLTQQGKELLKLSGLEVRNENNLLAYPDDEAAAGSVIAYNTLQVPVGGEYQVQLPDGTKVWLNSASSLKYPTHFTGDRREVELHGEAYFEVQKDAKQFVVTTGEVEVRVLGTKFNLSAYADDATIATTLVEGKVSMEGTAASKPTILTPDKQAVYSRANNKISVREVETGEYTAWKNGEFYFKKERLETILTKLARWYDIRVTYQHPSMKDKIFTGIALKSRPLEHILDLISKTSGINYRIENNKVILLEKE